MAIEKILVLRFSSIGDIVLTTPLLRCIKKQLPGVKIHYATKKVFREVLQYNPNIDKLYTFGDDVTELFEPMLDEDYDMVIDLHRNIRSSILKKKLNKPTRTFNKINVKKYMAVNFKWISLLPHKHIVDRYFETVAEMGVKSDGGGLDYFVSEEDAVDVAAHLSEGKKDFIALVIGGSYFTKKIPLEKLEEICANASLPVLLIGDSNDNATAQKLIKKFPHLVNYCGKLTINQSASVISQSSWVITSDTGMMHIASAFNKRIVSVWGNTIPEFGMFPYIPHHENMMLEVRELSCRPCSKLGFDQCPLKHFKCMRDIEFGFVSELK